VFCVENRRVSKRPRSSGRKVSLDGVLLLAKEALEEVIHETEEEDLAIIFSGGGIDCPSGLLRKN
jgi:hypothetical protein